MFMEMLLKSVYNVNVKKTPLLYMLCIYAVITNAHIMILHLKKCLHLDFNSHNYQTLVQFILKYVELAENLYITSKQARDGALDHN